MQNMVLANLVSSTIQTRSLICTIYQGQKYANQTHITVNANDVLVEYDVVPGAHPHGMDQKTFTKEELNKTIAQHKQEIDDYISEQGSNQDEDY